MSKVYISQEDAQKILKRVEKLENTVQQIELLNEREYKPRPRKTSEQKDEEMKQRLLATTH